MTPSFQHNVGAYIAPVTSVFPQSSGAATIDGSSIDRFAHNTPLSCFLHQVVGAIGVAPSAASVVTTLQHSPDNSNWTNYTPDGASVAAATPAVTAADTGSGVAVDLSAANRYIRSVTAVTLTGGTSPSVLVASDIILGGAAVLPAV